MGNLVERWGPRAAPTQGEYRAAPIQGEYRPVPDPKIQNIDTPTEPTQEIKDLIVKVQQKLICEYIVTINFVYHSYINMLL